MHVLLFEMRKQLKNEASHIPFGEMIYLVEKNTEFSLRKHVITVGMQWLFNTLHLSLSPC